MVVPAQDAKMKSRSPECPVESVSFGAEVNRTLKMTDAVRRWTALKWATSDTNRSIEKLMKTLQRLYDSLSSVPKRKWQGTERYYRRYRRIGEHRRRRARRGGKRT